MTLCTICSKEIPEPSIENAHLLADHKVFDFDGDLDYIELAHKECAVEYNKEHPNYWDFDEEEDDGG